MGSPIHDERIRKVLAKNVKAFLSMLEISEQALAARCKVSQKQVNNITNARTGCGIDALVEMAGVFGCEPGQLLEDSIWRSPQLHRRAQRLVSAYLLAGPADQDMIDQLTQKISSHKRVA